MLEETRFQEAKEVYYILNHNNILQSQILKNQCQYYSLGITLFSLTGEYEYINEAYYLGRTIFEKYAREDSMIGMVALKAITSYYLINNNFVEVENNIRHMISNTKLYSNDNEYTMPFFIMAEYSALNGDKEAAYFYLQEARKKVKKNYSKLENYYEDRINNLLCMS